MCTKNALILVLFVASISLSAQNCARFIENYCHLSDSWEYEINSQSISLVAIEGQVITLSAVFYENVEYSLGFCVHENLEKFQYKVFGDELMYEKETQITPDEPIEYLKFKCNTTRSLQIEVKIPKNTRFIEKRKKHCLGIVIEQKG